MPVGGVERWTCCDEKNDTMDNKEDVCQQVAGGSLMCCASTSRPLSSCVVCVARV